MGLEVYQNLGGMWRGVQKLRQAVLIFWLGCVIRIDVDLKLENMLHSTIGVSCI